MNHRPILVLLLAFGVAGLAGVSSLASEKCGYIYRDGPCATFWPLDLPYQWMTILDLPAVDYPPFVLYQVLADSVQCDSTCFGRPSGWCLRVQQVVVCPGESLGCGILDGPNESCGAYQWWSPTRGTVLLDNSLGFSAGDTVEVTGLIDRWAATTCMYGDGVLLNYQLASCRTGGVPTRLVTWGEIKAVFR